MESIDSKTQNFKIKTENFEGPLDLLLSLIEKRKLHINDISLSQVTDDFILHIENMPTYSVERKSDFILIASTLILIKSRSLLPTLTLTEEEEENIADLENRLRIYQKMKELSEHLKQTYGKNRIFFKSEKSKIIGVFSPHPTINLEGITSALKDAIRRFPVKELIPKVAVKKVMSLEDMIENLTQRVKSALKMSFHDFSGGRRVVSKEEKVNVIVSFLAMLELVKQGVIDAIQEAKHGDIKMETEDIGVPRY